MTFIEKSVAIPSPDTGSLSEKDKPAHIETAETTASSLEGGCIDDKALLRKLDKRIVPFLALLYLFSFVDRTNIGNARLFGLEHDLGLTPSQYSTCLAIFFVGYVLFEIPSNMIMKRWRPSMWLPIIMLAWGLVMTMMGIVENFAGLMATRAILGVTEAGLFPGVSWFVTLWYRRAECAFRISLFFAAASVSGAFGGLLARLIVLMDGVGGLEGWRWIFILEGIATVVVAVIAFWALEDFPHTSKFLTPAEKKRVVERLAEDAVGLSNEWKSRFIWDAFKDWRMYFQGIVFLAASMAVYSFSLFIPTIINAMGYSAANSQLLSVPPYVCGGLTTVAGGYYSDRTGKRFPAIFAFYILAIIGFVMLIATTTPGVQYTGVFLAAMGIFPQVPLSVSWAGNNFGGTLKRAVGVAFVVGTGNCGGFAASYVYRSQDRPHFRPGHGAILGFLAGGMLAATVLRFAMGRTNRKRDLAEGGRQWTMEERAPYADEGDNAPFFRYIL